MPKEFDVLTSNGFQSLASLQLQQKVLNLDWTNKTFTSNYVTQILNYVSMIFFNVYSSQWISRVLLNQSVSILPFPQPLAAQHTSEILRLLCPDQYHVALVGSSFEDIPKPTADHVQALACIDGIFCVLQATDLAKQLYQVEFPDSELFPTDFEQLGVEHGVESVAISTAMPYNTFVCRVFTDSFTIVPFLVKH